MVEYLWRASHGKPLQFSQWPCIFYGRLPALFPIAYMRYRRGHPSPSSIDHREGQDRFQNEQMRRAARYALRASRSVVVSLSLSRRNAASESVKKAMVHYSWLVKTCHYTRIGCDEISLAGFPREAPTVRPWAVYFCELRTANS